MEQIVIKPKAGLCNRLRFLFSYIYKMKKENTFNNKSLVIIWKIDVLCNGFLWDIIEPIPNCIALKNNDKKIKINSSSCGPIELYKNENYLENLHFKPRNHILNNIINIIKMLNNKYIAVHIRRSDLSSHLKHLNKSHLETKDEEYIDFLNKNSDYDIFIATDNIDTQNKFLNLYPTRIKYINKINDNKNHRKTSLDVALIDIFVCSFSNKFKGTYYSSFSSFIELMRRHNDITDDNNTNPLFYTEKLLNIQNLVSPNENNTNDSVWFLFKEHFIKKNQKFICKNQTYLKKTIDNSLITPEKKIILKNNIINCIRINNFNSKYYTIIIKNII